MRLPPPKKKTDADYVLETLWKRSGPPPKRKVEEIWPARCVTFYLRFRDQAAITRWLNLHSPDAAIYKVWQCAICRDFHVICYPREITGTSSGKSCRKEDFLLSRGYTIQVGEDGEAYLAKPK
jgi:hypothetical protein